MTPSNNFFRFLLCLYDEACADQAYGYRDYVNTILNTAAKYGYKFDAEKLTHVHKEYKK